MTAADPSPKDAPGCVSGYASAEFRLESPGILFGFKLRNSKTAPLFALFSKDSQALARLKTGTTVSMTFYHQDKTIPPVNLETRIRYIREAGPPGSGNTVMVGLEIPV